MSLLFSRRLVLNRWLLSLFGVSRFEELADLMRREEQEGLDEHNVHRFHHALASGLPDSAALTVDELLAYDQNIVRHTRTLNERRLTRGKEAITWKYFQYLALLLTEIYLERYFQSPDALLADLNAYIDRWNEAVDRADRVPPFDEDAEAWPQLNKISLWMATGSGKTLLMHANILQFRHYLHRDGKARDMNRILLLTPNEGLSRQHLREFESAGIEAEIFDKDARGLFSGHAVEILEVTKLREEMGDTTVAVDAFEENNLVLVDEGHRGASSGGGGTWMSHRNALCARGFSFEYSATFGQAVKNSSRLADAYAKNILFDYSYRFFHEDGFGKDYEILNLSKEIEEEHLETYLVAGLLGYLQQLLLFTEHADNFRAHQIEKPLWVFVGSSVTKGLGSKDASDIVEILGFLERFVSDRPGSVARIDRVLNKGLLTASGQNLLAGRFGYLNTSGRSPAEIYNEALHRLFHAPAGGRLYVENLKGAEGEVALRVGADNEAFGVVNVGDDTKLIRLCEKVGLATGDREFAGSLFHEINEDHSPVNLLIGSKKFTEGWSSWRVSTMGLMNVGRKEGAQIIQLFGRGVRLRGYEMSLKRSVRATLPEGVERPKHMGLLETLAIFGVHADYMAQFRDFLRDEGLPPNEDRVEIILPVIRDLGVQKLKTVRLKKTINGVSTEGGGAFKRLAPVPTISGLDPADPVTPFFQKNPVVLNWYPKIQAMRSIGLGNEHVELERNQAWLAASHLAFLDLDALLLELERFKADRGWSNLNLTRAGIRALLENPSWYRVAIPDEALAHSSFDRVALWHEVALALLKKFVERFYSYRRRQWELPHLEYRALDDNDPNLLGVRESAEDDGYYRILVDRSRAEIVQKLEELKKAIERGEMKSWEFQGLKAVWFGRHLYQPLLHLQPGSKLVEVSPAPLNKGELEFVQDLRAYCDRQPEALDGRELYLLRNLSRGRGVGFFQAENFHPDFILWLVSGAKQHVLFVDPKGIRHLEPDHDKIRFHATIKEIEDRLADPDVRLESFILSNTASHEMRRLWNLEKAEMEARHILFQNEDKGRYVGAMLEAAGIP